MADSSSDGEALDKALDEGAALDPEEYDSFLVTLGLEKERDAHLLWVAEYAFSAPMPPSWSEHVDEELRIYFNNHVTGQSSWSHPLDQTFKEVIAVAMSLAGQDSLRVVEAHLQDVQAKALKTLEGWSGPYATTGQDGGVYEYYFNEKTGQSTWESPVAEFEYDLCIRYWILSHVAQGSPPHGAQPAGPPPSPLHLEPATFTRSVSDGSVGGLVLSRDLLTLPLHLVRDDGQRGPGAPADAGAGAGPAAPQTPNSETQGYTTRSFYSARSTARESARDSARELYGRYGAAAGY